MLRILTLVASIYSLSAVSEPLESQEIQLPGYILSEETADTSTKETDELGALFEDELTALLEAEKEMLPQYKFKASVLVLNKNTNAKEIYELENGTTVIAGPLEISAANCLQNYKDTTHNDYIFLNILNHQTQAVLYHNWMSRRLPGVMPFSHTTYSVKLLSCKTSGELEPSAVTAEPEQPQAEVPEAPVKEKEPLVLPEALPDIMQPLNLIGQ